MVNMSAAVVTRTVQSSDLSRRSKDVFAAVEKGPVTITRRDGEDLVLSKASDAAQQQEGLKLAAQLVAASLAPDDEPFVDRLRLPFPWIEFLSGPERQDFAEELVSVARACASVGRFDRLLITIHAWEATATALASGYTADVDLHWLDEGLAVTHPAGE